MVLILFFSLIIISFFDCFTADSYWLRFRFTRSSFIYNFYNFTLRPLFYRFTFSTISYKDLYLYVLEVRITLCRAYISLLFY
jgi:hypothetical protein